MDPISFAAFLKTEPEAVTRMRQALETLSSYARGEGFELVPYLDSELNQFRKLPAAMGASVLAAVTDYCETMTSVRESNEPLLRNLNSVWLQLRKMGLRAPDDFFPQLEPQDIVEIYDMSGVQLFRSFHFFQYCSYDLETLLCNTWYELFARPLSAEQAYMAQFGRIIAGQVKGVEAIGVEDHVVSERLGRHRQNLIRPGVMCMLHDRQGKPRAWAATLRVEAFLG